MISQINWNEHCKMCVTLKDMSEVEDAIQILLEVSTCFAVATSELTVYTTERGAAALVERL